MHPPPDWLSPRPYRPSLEKGLATDGLYISDVFRGETSGMNMVAATYPVRNAAGATVGLLSIPVRLEFFQQLIKRVKLQPGSVAGILDGNGVLVARVPDGAEWRGMSGSGSAIVDAAKQGAVGPVEVKAPDDIVRVYVYRPIAELGWTVFVGIESKVLFTAFQRQLIQGIVIFLVVLTLSLAYAQYIGRRVSRPLEKLVVVAAAIATGDNSIRAQVEGDDEIARVARHFNHMVEVLAKFRESLQDSNRRLHELMS
jgi:methyl-accepting chemotaxis protein